MLQISQFEIKKQGFSLPNENRLTQKLNQSRKSSGLCFGLGLAPNILKEKHVCQSFDAFTPFSGKIVACSLISVLFEWFSQNSPGQMAPQPV